MNLQSDIGHIIDYFKGKDEISIDSYIGDFSISDIEKTCLDISIDMIRHVLKKLKKEGQVASLGQGPYALSVREEFVRLPSSVRQLIREYGDQTPQHYVADDHFCGNQYCGEVGTWSNVP